LWKIKIPRCLIPSPMEETDSTELHVYGDASKWAYGAVAYLKVISKDKTTVRFIMSKSRVAPLKTITLPRLELMAALIAAKLVSFIKNSLAIPIQRVICWTDSQIALSWIRSEAKNWKPFVKNRVELIQQLTEPKLWKYCPSENNPADLISRGTSVTKLKDSRLWWEGPPSLLNPESCEKTSDEYTQHPDALEERSLFSGISSISDDQYEYVIDPSRYQTFSKLARVTAWCLRFAKNCRHPSNQRQEELTIEELNKAELYWMKTVQNETFRDEKSLLIKGKLSENSRLIHLTPFIDEVGVMRVGGRLQQSNLLYQHKHPTILPNKHTITDLIIQGEHKHQWHAGVEQTLAALRKRFWILKGRSAVKRVLRRCVVCRKENARCLNQIMAPLPKNRLVETHAFDNVGIDFAGPLYVKEGRTISKIYICLFTCMATRAIHLEPTSDMTTQSFLAAFRRFISRRGKPSVVQTDNFRTFKLADKYIQDLFRGDEKQKIARAMTEEKIEWRFSSNPNLKDWKYLQSFDLADQFPRPAAEIDVLIGMDFYHKFATNETIKSGENGPHAMESSLGWILSGPIATNADEGVVMFSEIETENDDETLQKFWRLDSMGIQEPSNEVHGTNSFLKDSIHYDGNRYVVELPWINNMKMLPDNFELAWTRLQQTERVMLKNPDVATAYRETLNDYLDNNIIEEIDKDKGKEGNIWYLPHRMVVRDDNSTTKFRIVFDGSAKYKGISLNEYLDAGPALQSDMVGVLLRFRLYSIAVQADIMKMFLQIGLKEKDRDVTRFLWKDPSRDKLHVYRFNRVCFGLTCSPFLAMAVIRHHAELKKEVHPEAAQIVENNIYVDDVLLSVENQEAAR
ncbi:hypothetical protein T4A_1795, partial [Trichinella pseudospiralis]